MVTVLIPAATAAVARLNAVVAGAALIEAVALVKAAVLVEAALVEVVALIEAVALVDAARVEAALVAGSICHRPPRNRQSDNFSQNLILSVCHFDVFTSCWRQYHVLYIQ